MPVAFILAWTCLFGPVAGAAAAEPFPASRLFPDGQGREVLRVDYESGALTALPKRVIADSPPAADAMTICDEAPRRGKFCLRVKVVKDDAYISHGCHRAESHTMGDALTRYNHGDVFRYRFSFKLHRDWSFTADGGNVIWQFKRYGPRPDAILDFNRNDLTLAACRNQQRTLIRDCRTETWYDVCLTVRWSTGADGRIEAYCKTADEPRFHLAASLAGENLGDAQPNATYLKWGLYNPNWKNIREPRPAKVIYFDEIIVDKAMPAARSPER